MSKFKLINFFILISSISCSTVQFDYHEMKPDYSICFEKKIGQIIGKNREDESQNIEYKIIFNPIMAGFIDSCIFEFKPSKTLSSLERLKRQKSFAYLVNQVPRNYPYWVPNEKLLWNEYYDKLCSIDIEDGIENKGDAEKKIFSKEIVAQCQKEYEKFAESYLNTTEKYEKSKLNIDTVEMKIYSEALKVIYNNWNVSGFKDQFESIVGRMAIENNNNKLIRISNAMNDMNPLSSEYYISDPNHENYYYTTFYPELNKYAWIKDEFAVIDPACRINTIDPASKSYAVIGPRISFQYCIIHVSRQWFHPDLLNEKSSGLSVTTKDSKRNKISFITSIILVKEMKLNFMLHALENISILEKESSTKILKKNSTLDLEQDLFNNIKIAAYVCAFQKGI